MSALMMCILLTCLAQASLRLKGENGIMRKKFQALQKDIEEQREQLSLQHEQQKELYTTIKGEQLLVFSCYRLHPGYLLQRRQSHAYGACTMDVLICST